MFGCYFSVEEVYIMAVFHCMQEMWLWKRGFHIVNDLCYIFDTAFSVSSECLRVDLDCLTGCCAVHKADISILKGQSTCRLVQDRG